MAVTFLPISPCLFMLYPSNYDVNLLHLYFTKQKSKEGRKGDILPQNTERNVACYPKIKLDNSEN